MRFIILFILIFKLNAQAQDSLYYFYADKDSMIVGG